MYIHDISELVQPCISGRKIDTRNGFAKRNETHISMNKMSNSNEFSSMAQFPSILQSFSHKQKRAHFARKPVILI